MTTGVDIWAQQERLDETQVTQPALVALQIALYRLLESFGMRPDYLIGHSVGELSAAHVAGVLSLDDAVKLVRARAELMGALPSGGEMLAIAADEDELELPDGVSLAGINGPKACVISGPREQLEPLKEGWEQKGRQTSWLRTSHAFHSALMEPMLDQFAELCQELSYQEPQIPIVSNLTGELGEAFDAAYWPAQARSPVRYADGIATLEREGVSQFYELGPDPVLATLAGGCIEGEANIAATLRKGRPDAQAFGEFLCRVGEVNWQAYYAGSGARHADLPTYAFQHERYWLAPAAGADVVAAGLSRTDHPLLGVGLHLAGEDQWAFSGRLSLATQPWLADHTVLDATLLSGTSFVEVGLAAGRQVECEQLEEIVLEAPLALPAGAGVAIQLLVEAADNAGRRAFTVYSREDDAVDDEWRRHASGVLAPASEAIGSDLQELGAERFPPDGAEPIAVDGLYDRLAEMGLGYGPAFQGVTAAWRRGEELFVEVGGQASDADHFGLHPGLLDSTLHAGFTLSDGADVRLPFAWRGVRLLRTGVASLRARVAAAGNDAVTIAAVDGEGVPVIAVEAVSGRPVDAAALGRAGSDRSLYDLSWTELPRPATNGHPARFAVVGDLAVEGVSERYEDLDSLAETIAAGEDLPDLSVLIGPASGGSAPVEAAHAGAGETLALLQRWIADERLGQAKLVLVTSGAVAIEPGDEIDPAAATIWGLVRSAQSEHPGRFLLVDVDGTDVHWPEVVAAAEPQVATRGGRLLVPRIERIGRTDDDAEPDFGDGAVLVTGGTGGLGALLARHLATAHGVSRLVLASRSGLKAEGAAQLRDELAELGCEVQVETCDVSDRGALARMLDSVGPLSAVVHTAGVLEDATIDSLDDERPGAGAGAEGRRGLASARAHRRDAAVGVRALLFGGGDVRGAGPSQLRGRQRLFGRPCASAARSGAARHLACLGRLDGGHGRCPRAGWPVPTRAPRHDAPAGRAGTRPVRRRAGGGLREPARGGSRPAGAAVPGAHRCPPTTPEGPGAGSGRQVPRPGRNTGSAAGRAAEVRMGSQPCSRRCAATSRPCSDWARLPRWSPRPRSRTSASTRSPRSSCAIGSAPPVA